MDVNMFAEILEVTDLTVRRMIKDGKLEAEKLENRTYQIEDYEILRYVLSNAKYRHAKVKVLEYIAKKEGIVPGENKDSSEKLDVEKLNMQITRNSIRNNGTEMVKAFKEYLDEAEDLSEMSKIFREIENTLDVMKQPTTEKIVEILEAVVSVKTHEKIKVGEVLTGQKIEELFGRQPQQEGINFCADTKELYIITKLGVNNPTVEFAEYNDVWKLGKILYEGKGQSIQEFKGSNLHLHRKYLVYTGKIQCKEGVPDYIHVFNKISNDNKEKFQYLGIFDVTDFMINEHSAGLTQETKTAIVFELTPRVNKTSTIIDDNYIF